MKVLAVGAGAGGSGDRIGVADAVVETLMKHDGPASLIFENLAERTLAFAQIAKRADPESGFEPALDLEIRPVLARCMAHGIPIIGNFGAANPAAAAQCIARISEELGLGCPRIAIIEGDDLSGPGDQALIASFLEQAQTGRQLVAANVYIGAAAIAAALREGAQVVVGGRIADPSLTLGPALAHFGWSEDDWDRLAGASVAGHLLECGAQVSGGYFADPGRKHVPDLANAGYPIAEIDAEGGVVITKATATGGMVSTQTVKEQLLYEIHDPSCYITPDVVVDLSNVTVTQVGADRVHVAGVKGHARTSTLKAIAFFEGGWLGEAEVSYAGPNAEARARLGIDVIKERMGAEHNVRFDLIGLISIFGDDANQMLRGAAVSGLTDVRLRAAMRANDEADVDRLHREVNSFPMTGPAGGGGVRVYKRRRLSNISFLLPRDQINERHYFMPEHHDHAK